LAQDDYWYEIHLSNKQLVFYFMAAATGLILSFLAGVMVGRGVDASADPALAASRAQRAEERVVTEEPVRPAPPSPQELTYAQRLEAERAEDMLEKPSTARPAASPPPPAAAAARPSPPPATPRASPPPALTRAPAAGGAFAIQVGSFKDRASAEAVMNRLKGKGLPAYVQPRDGGLFNVRVGPYGSRADAEQVQGRIKQQESPGAFIVAN
jgi:DedD protein